MNEDKNTSIGSLAHSYHPFKIDVLLAKACFHFEINNDILQAITLGEDALNAALNSLKNV